MSEEENKKNVDIILGSIASILLISTIVGSILKFTGTIDWSWWLILAPIWVPVTVIVFMWLLVTVTED